MFLSVVGAAVAAVVATGWVSEWPQGGMQELPK